MKTITFFTVMILILSVNILVAENEPSYSIDKSKGATPSVITITLSPMAPREADYEDVDLSCIIPIPASFFKTVSPALPRYAEFDDDILPVHLGKVVPTIPAGER